MFNAVKIQELTMFEQFQLLYVPITLTPQKIFPIKFIYSLELPQARLERYRTTKLKKWHKEKKFLKKSICAISQKINQIT